MKISEFGDLCGLLLGRWAELTATSFSGGFLIQANTQLLKSQQSLKKYLKTCFYLLLFLIMPF